MARSTNHRHDQAVLLRRSPYGESSLVVQLLTREHGLVSVLAKGVYRLKSRYFATLDWFDTLNVEWRATGGRELTLLVAASIQTRRHRLATDLERYRAALTLLELTRAGARPALADPLLFDRCTQALDLLLDPAAPPALVLVGFDLAFLDGMGLSPALEHCASCGRDKNLPTTPRVPFSFGAGGRLCISCADAARGHGERIRDVSLQAVRVAGSLKRTPFAALPRVRLDPAALAGVRELLSGFLEYHLESPLKSRRPAPRPPRSLRPV